MSERLTATAYRATVRRKPRDLEGPIHRSILAHLRAKLPGAVIHHAANEMNHVGTKVQRARYQERAKSLGMLPGFPDLLVIWRGWVLGFEVKAPGNYPTPAQKDVGAAIIDNGGQWACVRSVADVDACLSDWVVGLVEVTTAEGAE